MQNLWLFLARNYHWFLFLLLEIISVTMLFSYNSYQGSVWISSANAVTGTIYKWQSDVEHFFTLAQHNKQLTMRNLLLEQEIVLLRNKYAEITKDTAALKKEELRKLADFGLIEAKVVSNSINRHDNLITIDKGRKDGIEPDMGVVCGTGIVGVVYLVGDHYSVVVSALNNRSRISCSVRSQGYFGYLTWDGGDPTRAFVEDIPRHAKLRKGDWIETSGYSSIFPPGVSVGQIEKIYNSSDGLSFRLLIKLSTDFGYLHDVCVISDKGIIERLRLQEAARDSLMLTPKKE